MLIFVGRIHGAFVRLLYILADNKSKLHFRALDEAIDKSKTFVLRFTPRDQSSPGSQTGSNQTIVSL